MNKDYIPTILVTTLVLLILAAGIVFSQKNSAPKSNVIDETTTPTQQESELTMQPETNTSPAPLNKDVTVTMKTSEGNITLLLTGTKTPITVGNFVALAKEGFYNNTVFHRTIKDFMIQGGDPKGDGTGGPGYKFNDEAFDGEYTKGTIAMANAGPNTNGSQFFIMHADYNLPKNYVIFGKVTQGLEVVDKIATAAVTANTMSGENSKPVSPVKILSIEVKE